MKLILIQLTHKLLVLEPIRLEHDLSVTCVTLIFVLSLLIGNCHQHLVFIEQPCTLLVKVFLDTSGATASA